MAEDGDQEPEAKKARVEDNGDKLEIKCINTIRAFCIDMVQKANSGHPGAPMGCAPLAYLLWGEIMNYSPSDPTWRGRDRFVLSNGHACALQYCMLHLTGYDVTLEDCKKFRQVGSKTPGHPESFATPGIEVCTGPLGQGISNAVGLAIGQRQLAATYPDAPFDNYTYVICGDGCLQEGISSEASSLAGHLGLGKLIVLYDDNRITIDGSTELSFTEDVNKRYEAYGWHVQTVSDVQTGGLDSLRAAVAEAQKATDRPSIIKVRTTIGYGSAKEGSEKTHGAPLGAEDVASVKKKFDLDPTKTFQVDDDVKEFWADRVKSCEATREAWVKAYAEYGTAHVDDANEIDRRFQRKMVDEKKLLDVLPKFEIGKDKDLATRKFSNLCLNALAPIVPELIGGSADLTGSNLTSIGSADFQKSTPEGRYIRYGVREHGMAAISNGLYAYGAYRPFCATFLNFVGYALGAIRLSALSRFGVIYVMTHDSIGLGEDGPTHQPVETIESLRAMPNMHVFRPADSNEMSAAYLSALQHGKTPTTICCTRSTVPALELSSVEKALLGAYVAYETDPEEAKLVGEEVKLILIATGSEVGPCVEAAGALKSVRVRVVSMPCQELFLKQPEEYQRTVLPGNVPTMSVEAASINGWHRFAHRPFGLTTFGMSGKGAEVFAHFGFTAENLMKEGESLLKFYMNKPVPDLMDRPFTEADTTKMNGGH